MQHTFASSDGPVEVTLARLGDGFVLEGHELTLHNRGRLQVRLSDGRTCLAHAPRLAMCGGSTSEDERFAGSALNLAHRVLKTREAWWPPCRARCSKCWLPRAMLLRLVRR